MSDKLNIQNDEERKNSILINEYNSERKFKNFVDLDQRLSKHYDRIFDTVTTYEISPRFFYESGLKIGFRDIFYYIDMLYDNNPDTVIDVGCGECIWKRWFPRIIGFDPNTNEFSQQDFVDFFDKSFSKGHTKHYHNGMALNSVHFISWNDIEVQINQVMNIVRERFLFTFNFNSMTNLPTSTMSDRVREFYSRLTKMNYKIIMFDAPVLRGIDEKLINNWAHVNGTVRFILEHNNG